MPQFPPSPHRSPRGRSAVAKAAASGTGLAACVVGGLLGGQPELSLLVKATAGMAKLELVEDRFALVATILTLRPGALVLPPFDGDRTSTAPLVLRVRREAPQVAVLVIAAHPTGAGQPLLRAVQGGAHAITCPTPAELREALMNLLESPPANR